MRPKGGGYSKLVSNDYNALLTGARICRVFRHSCSKNRELRDENGAEMK